MTNSIKTPIWVYPQNDPAWQKKIVDEFQIHPVTAQILISRGFTSLEGIHEFLYAKLPSLHSPSLFADMDKAVQRILLALKRKERIVIFGDNDVDGMTGVALLVDLIHLLHGNVIFYLPNRIDLKKSPLGEALKLAQQKECSLLITVDCGITAKQEVEEAGLQDLDIIITDHHEPTSRMPHCIATLNPKLINSVYPNRELTGVGVAFKLAHAIVDQLTEEDLLPQKIDLKDFLDLVALGTIADMGSLLGENRILVRYGLNTLKKTRRIGLVKLFSISDLNTHTLTPADIASKIAPRLNSLGRIADPKLGVELLLCKDEKRAEELAKKLDLYNLERQKIERLAYEDVENTLKKHPEILKEKAIILSSTKWHPGIIAIITTKIAKQYNRPTVIIALEHGIGKGSMRTISAFPLLPVLRETEDLLMNYGGHDFAAGLSIKEGNITKFKEKLLHLANQKLKEQDIALKLFLDAKINFDDLTFDFLESLNLLHPFGHENPPPILYSDATQTWPPKFVGKAHLKLFLQQNDRALEGIAFNMGERRMELVQKKDKIRVAFTPYVNIFLNKSSIHLQVKDFKSAK